MGLDIRLEDKEGKTIEEAPDLENVLSRVLPSWDDTSFHLLRYIDPWGDTMFNHLQMDELVEELRRIREKTANEVERTFISKVGTMALRCKDGEHLYLKFLGD